MKRGDRMPDSTISGYGENTPPSAIDPNVRTTPPQLAPLLPAGEPVESLLRNAQFFLPGEPSSDYRELHRADGRRAEEFYRERWRHDKVVRSTHGVNCTGSCSWKVYVKDGIITWETQQTDYPSVGPDSPEYEPRGCPRGASFSWYTYSPSRVRYPYVRAPLLQLWRDARARHGDPVAAWAEIVADPAKTRSYKSMRGKGGFVRSTWSEVVELIAAAHVHTIREFGPDRVVGFTPIPAMSQVSYAAGSRFLSMIGGTILSFYDWYADLPPASPQVFGDQTDVPESGDWWNSSYLILWGTNLPITRTPDAHFMTEARYKGQKVVVVSPDYSDHTKFADDWLPANPGTDGALAMAMGHVVLSEFYRDRSVPYFTEYARLTPICPSWSPCASAANHTCQTAFSPPLTSPTTTPQLKQPRTRRLSSTTTSGCRECPTVHWVSDTTTAVWASGTSSSATSTQRSRCTGGTLRRCR